LHQPAVSLLDPGRALPGIVLRHADLGHAVVQPQRRRGRRPRLRSRVRYPALRLRPESRARHQLDLAPEHPRGHPAVLAGRPRIPRDTLTSVLVLAALQGPAGTALARAWHQRETGAARAAFHWTETVAHRRDWLPNPLYEDAEHLADTELAVERTDTVVRV